MSIIAKIDAFLNESKVGDLAGKVLRTHGVPMDGIDPAKLTARLASAHNLDPHLIPHALHSHLSVLHAAITNRKHYTNDEDHAKIQSRVPAFHAYLKSGEGVDAEFSYAADATREYHALMTHPSRDDFVKKGVETAYDAGENHADEVRDEGGDHEQVRNASRLRTFRTVPEFHATVKAYNPLKIQTARYHKIREYGDSHDSILHNTFDAMRASEKLKPAFPSSAEHVGSDGTRYRGYTLDTEEKANAGCWGERYCIATGDGASSANRHYHGGSYRTSHIITRQTDGEKESLHAAYVPGMLPGQHYAKPDQAVRNSGNNGAIKGKEFKTIHPLLSKLDPRIDSVAHHYSQTSEGLITRLNAFNRVIWTVSPTCGRTSQA